VFETVLVDCGQSVYERLSAGPQDSFQGGRGRDVVRLGWRNGLPEPGALGAGQIPGEDELQVGEALEAELTARADDR
jgi:hypothetical protein